jgi:hypothetical protein
VKPEAIDLYSGSVNLDDVSFRSIPFIRFRKPLTAQHDLKGSENIQAVNESAERTVVILGARDLSRSLEELRFIEVLPDSPRSRYAARNPQEES